MIQLSHIKARVTRLQQLSMDLAKEATAWKNGEGRLLYLERKAYINAMMNVLAGGGRSVSGWRSSP